MMTETDKLHAVLERLDPAVLDYDAWLKIGMACKSAGLDCSHWDCWSSRDVERYIVGDCDRRWRSPAFGHAIGVGTAVEIARQHGVDIYSSFSPALDRPIPWDAIIPADAGIAKEWRREEELPRGPATKGVGEMIAYLEALFNPEDCVGIVSKSTERITASGKTKICPQGFGEYDRTAKKLIESLRRSPDITNTIGTYSLNAGAWIRFNPLDGKGVGDSNVIEYRYTLIESDNLPIEEQYAIYKDLRLPIAALVTSGGKSLHAIVKIDAGADRREYEKRVNKLHEICNQSGFVTDGANRNPSRLSRLPGVDRGDNHQSLIAVNVGCSSWQEWVEWLAETNDELPNFEDLGSVFNNPPDLAPVLIENILRCGHKMLISGPSKAGKSFLLINLAISIAEGRKWLGKWQCKKGRVLYINLELDRPTCIHRFIDIFTALGATPTANNIDIWHLRGRARPLPELVGPLVRRCLKAKQDNPYVAIIFDPIYKIISGDENAADEMGRFCNQFDKICTDLQCSAIYCHHHSKGLQGGKSAVDRASGSGVFARDPDAIIDLIGLDIPEDRRPQITSLFPSADLSRVTAWRMSGSLREFPSLDKSDILFCYPMHRQDSLGLLKDVEYEEEARVKRTSNGRVPERYNETFEKLSLQGGFVTLDEFTGFIGRDASTIRRNIRRHGNELNFHLIGEKLISKGTQDANDDDF